MEAQELLETIKDFVAADKDGFSTDAFSSSTMLIEVMKGKSSKQSLQQRTDELVEKENESEELVEEITGTFADSYDLVLQSPALYGQQIEKLRGCIATAKKKIAASKQSLLKNDKDLQQLNFNSLYNKLIFNKLKSVESELAKLQAAASHIKHRRYLECSLSLPILSGRTLLEDHIQNKAQALKDELYTACSMEVYSFCYLTGDVVLPSQSTMLERMKEHRGSWHLDESVPNMEEHMPLYEKYRLLRQVELQSYLKFLWSWEDFDGKFGRLAVIYDVVRAVFNISRSQQLLEYISLNFKKAVSNLYMLLLIFLVYDEKTLAESTKERPHGKIHFRSFYGLCGFNSKDKLERVQKFFAAAVCFSAILARKFIIVRKIYQEFRIDTKVPDTVDAGAIMALVLDELLEHIQVIFFPRERPPEEVTPLQKFLASSIQVFTKPSFLEFPLVQRTVDGGIRNILESLLIVKEVELDNSMEKTKTLKELKSSFYDKLFKGARADFNKELETKWIECIYQLLNSHTNRLFLPILFSEFESVVDSNDLHERLAVTKSLAKIKSFLSEQKKQIIKEPIACAFYLEELICYSTHADLEPSQTLKLSLFLVMMLYLRVTNHVGKTFFQEGELRCIDIQAKRRTKQFRDLEESCFKHFPNIFRESKLPAEEGSDIRKKDTKRRGVINGVSELTRRNSSSIFAQFRLNDKLRVLVNSLEYLLANLNELLKPQLAATEPGPFSNEFQRRLDNHEGMNLDDNMMIKARSLFELLPGEASALRQCFLTLIRRIVNLYVLLKVRCSQIGTNC